MFNISKLPDYVDQTSKTLLVQSVFGNQTASVLKDAGSVTIGLKGKAAINLLAQDVNIQTSYGCGRTPMGDTTFSQAYITVTPLKDEENLCPKPLENKWTVQYLSKSQTYTEALFANEIMAARADLIAQANEVLLWQGNTTASGSTNLNKLDGFIVQIKASNAVVITGGTVASGATVIEKLQALFIAAPSKITAQSDAVMFLGTDVYNEYKMALAVRNLFKPDSDMNLWGANIKLVPVDGLIGTRMVFAGRLRSFQMGTDILGEEDKATMQYSIETQNIYMDFHWALGVTVVYANEISYATV